jgi:hypothetical protein
MKYKQPTNKDINCLFHIRPGTNVTNIMSLQLNFVTDYFLRFSYERKLITYALWQYVQKNVAVPIVKLIVISYIGISSEICALWYAIYARYQLLHVSTLRFHSRGFITTKVHEPTYQSSFCSSL